MASLMADSLENASEHFLKLTRFDKLTALSRTLRDDPSCQLCSILVKYCMTLDLDKIEKTYLRLDQVPPLITLRQGIVVLSRQWKNELYAPILIEYKLRSRDFKNLFNTQDQYDSIIAKAEFEGSEFDEEEDGSSSDDDVSEFDEQSLLIKNKKGNYSVTSNSSGLFGGGNLSPSQFEGLPLSKDDPVLRLIDPRRRYSGDSELLSFPYDPTAVQSETATQVNSGEVTPTPRGTGQNESLYDWMRRQDWKRNLSVKSGSSVSVEKGDTNIEGNDISNYREGSPVGKKNEDKCKEGDDAEAKDRNKFQDTPSTPQTKSMNLLDAHIIFEPLLSSLGLMPQQIQNVSLKNLGKNISILANVDVFKIDIVESEIFGASRQRSKRIKGVGITKVSLDSDTSSPAFLCEKMYVQLDQKKVTDLQNTMGNDVKEMPLYISRAQMRRHTSKYINFNIDISNIAPKVNMPLLRLLNQILTMHQNVRETNEELKEKKPGESMDLENKKDTFARHKKSSSNASSSSSNVSLAQLRQNSQEETNMAGTHHVEINLDHTPENSMLHTMHSDTLRMSELSSITREAANQGILKQTSPSVTLKSQLRNRPKSFAQKFRPNSRLAGMTAYSNIGESPIEEPKDSFILTNAPLERISEEKATEKCWKTMYNLLELYSTMPTTKTVHRQSVISQSMHSTAGIDTGILLKPARTAAIASTPVSINGGPSARPVDAGDLYRPDISNVTERNVTSFDISTPIAKPANQLPDYQTQESLIGTHRIENETSNPTSRPTQSKKTKGVSFAKTDLVRREHTPLIVSGIAKIHCTKLTATLSGLKLEGEITGLQSSLQYKEKMRAPLKGVVEASVVGSMKDTTIVLLEGIPPKQQTVVKVTIGQSEIIHSSHMWKTKDKNTGTMFIDLVQIVIPQHPVDLHSIVTRGTKELSSTLEEFRGVRKLKRGTTFAQESTAAHDGVDGYNYGTIHESPAMRRKEESIINALDTKSKPALTEKALNQDSPKSPTEDSNLIKPFVMNFNITLEKLLIGAALLPSLEAEYSMFKVTSKGVTGSKAKFIVDIPKHILSFNTKLDGCQDNIGETDINNGNVDDVDPENNFGDTILPKEASIDLPLVHVSAAYIVQELEENCEPKVGDDGSILSEGNYLKAEAEIGELQHTLTTDLLNHLVFVQKVFMKEVNEVVQKMSGSDKPVPIFSEFGEEVDETAEAIKRPLLFSVAVRLREITITATTPSNSYVRFETEHLSELQLSNRIENVIGGISDGSGHFRGVPGLKPKISTQAKIDMKLSLGQIIRDQVYYEAATEYQHQAYFKTSIQLRNAFQGEANFGDSSQNDSKTEREKDVINITLSRPLIFVQPVAVDRAILFWLSYKNAYEYWTDQRLNLNKEVLEATDQVLEKVPISQITSQLSAQHVGTLFLQLNVKDIGVCLPLSMFDPSTNQPLANKYIGSELNGPSCSGAPETMGAIIATVKSSSISACSAVSMVSTGKFIDLCVRFSDDFHHSLDDWKPDPKDGDIMNLCKVEEGSYEVCSKTAKAVKDATGTVLENAKWFLNIQWKMKGVDAKVDTNIGKYMSSLGQTLTALGGSSGPADINYPGFGDGTNTESSSITDTEEDLNENPQTITASSLRRQTTKQTIDLDLPAFLFDPNLERSVKAKYLEKEINEQAQTVEDFQKFGASEATISVELKKLQELQNIASQNFRHDIAQKLKRTKSKASYLKEKLGLGLDEGPTPRNHKLRKCSSVVTPSPIQEESEKPFGKLKRIKSGEALTTLEEMDNEDIGNSLSSTRSTASAFDNIEGNQYFRSDKGNLFEYDESPHFPRDKSKFNISPKSTLNITQSSSSSTLKPNNSTTMPSGTNAEQNVDFEFHVKIDINRGECVLHTGGQDGNAGTRSTKMRKDRSFSGNIYEQSGGSPSMSRKSRHGGPDPTSRLRDSANYRHSAITGQLPDETIFFIPGLDVRAHYVSKREIEETFSFDTSAMSGVVKGAAQNSTPGNVSWLSSTRKMGNKKATLSAWMTLQSIPEETLITPHILEFLEQALEPIPKFRSSNETTPISTVGGIGTKSIKGAADDDGAVGDGISSASDSQLGQLPAYYGQFPVDVIVYFHMQGSTFRFSCAPVSRVECMLRLPSLDLVFSSKRADGDVNDEFAVKNISSNMYGHSKQRDQFTSQHFKYSQQKGNDNSKDDDSPGDKSNGSLSSTDTFEDVNQNTNLTGGLSVTGCLNDFDLCVFHPYGFRKKDNAGENIFSPLSSEERKDSLSVNVAFVKFHLSRSRKVNHEHNGGSTKMQSEFGGTSGHGPFAFSSRANSKDDPSHSMNAGQIDDPNGVACVRFSTVVDIGSASFKYDMRRLTEILAFPRAWYRRTLVRRLFLGELRTTSFHTEQVVGSAAASNAEPTKEHKLSSGSDRRSSMNVSSVPNSRERRGSIIDVQAPVNQDSVAWIGKTTSQLWETLVVFAVHFKVLKVQMNMGNVMGNVEWTSKDFRSEGRLSFNSTGHKNMFISLGLNSSALEAKAGIVGGSVDLGRIDTYCHFKEDSGIEPFHELGLQLDVMAIRFDYMSNCALMARISHLSLSVKDDWHVQEVSSPPQIFVQGDLNWDQLQILISKSTTADLIKIVNKLEEFFSNQFKSSKKLFSDLEPLSNSTNREKYSGRERANRNNTANVGGMGNAEDNTSTSHHRHWQKALTKISAMKIYTLPFKLPEVGSVLGGVLELRGKHISLACFHGINFKSRSWALFSLKEPSISFVSDATQVIERGSPSDTKSEETHKLGDAAMQTNSNEELVTTIIQTLSVCLGQPESQIDQQNGTANNGYMATVKKLSRVANYLPPFKALTDWFIYAFKSSDLDEVHRFPILFQGSAQTDKGPDREVMKLVQKPEEIFALPCLRLDLKTKHVQGEKRPEKGDPRPLVDCTLVTG